MQRVNTVTGPVSTGDLGVTLMHEHLFTLYPEMRLQYPWDEEKVVADAVRKMKDLQTRGVKTLVDMTVFGLGRYIPRIVRIAKESGIQIVAATGIYTFYEMPTYFKMGIKDESPAFLHDFMIREIEEGISDTGVKAAVLKCASDHYGISKDVETILRTTAQVHRRTGVLIATHTDSRTQQGLAQQKIFKEEGVDLSRVMIGHVGDSTDFDYIQKILDNGSTIGMDRFGAERLLPLKDRVNTVAELCKRGYAKQMVLSHDTTSESDNLSQARIRLLPPGYEANRRFTYISDVVLPALLEAGVSQSDIDQMMLHNPRRIFEQTGAY